MRSRRRWPRSCAACCSAATPSIASWPRARSSASIPATGSPIRSSITCAATPQTRRTAATGPHAAITSKPASRLVSDREKNVRDEAIRSLKEARGLALDAIGAVVQAVKSEPDAEVRARAAEAVGEIGDASFAVDTAVKAAAAKEALPVLTDAVEQ